MAPSCIHCGKHWEDCGEYPWSCCDTAKQEHADNIEEAISLAPNLHQLAIEYYQQVDGKEDLSDREKNLTLGYLAGLATWLKDFHI